MNASMNDSRCPYCGGKLKAQPSHNGFQEFKCDHCNFRHIIESDEDIQQIYELGKFTDSTIELAHRRRAGGLTDKIEEWDRWSHSQNCNWDDCMARYGGNLANDPLFAMAYAAHLTYGFQSYGSHDNQITVEALYEVAVEELKKNPNAKKLKELILLYDKKLRKKSIAKKKWIGITCGIVVVACLATLIAVWALRSPNVEDERSGITVNIPANAISMFEKLSVHVAVEEPLQNSEAYTDAKTALKNETERFTLFDISLKNGKKNLDFDGSITIEIPIPSGYDPSSLKIFYIESAETFHELPSVVSASKNTISFETTHCSLFAVAERLPFIKFDTQGGSEVKKQSVKRGNLAQRPDNPQKYGYTFDSWLFENREWDFLTDTVTKDLTLVATWSPNAYTITFDANGGICESDLLNVTYMEAYGTLPNATKNGYVFAGWYTAAENGELVSADTTVRLAENHTLYAKWELQTFSVTLNTNGGQRLDAIQYNIHTETQVLPTPIRAGYNFLGWYTKEDFSDEKVESILQGSAYDITLYAKWSEPIRYSIAYVVNGGMMPSDPNSYTHTNYTVQDDLKLPVLQYDHPYSEYNRFVGWYEDEDLSIPFADDLSTNPRNIRLYAKWVLLDQVYIGKNNVPSSITQNRVLIDLSSDTGGVLTPGTVALSKSIDVTNVSELIIIGNPDKVYKDIYINVKNYDAAHPQLTIVLANITAYGNIAALNNHHALQVTLECTGTNGLISSNTPSAVISDFSDFRITGNGNLTVTSTHTCAAIQVGNLTVDGNLSLKVLGGDGTVGADGQCAPEDGKNGSDGTNGTNGGIGISAATVTVANGAFVDVTGGTGGDGGRGGCCNPSFSIQGDKEYGGDGGTGGAGGYGIDATSITVDKSSTLNVTGGAGGNGGAAGGIYKGQANGVNGDGGNGGAGGLAISDSCFVTGNVSATNGAKGEKSDIIDCANH